MTVHLYVLRHGPAADRDKWSGADADRPLTDKGRRTVRLVAQALARRGVAPDVVVTSPYTRALETAEIAARELGAADHVECDDRLAGSLGARSVRAILRDHPGAASVLLVGHEPTLSDTIGSLCGGGRVLLRKAGAARVDMDEQDEGLLVWLMQPDQLTP